MTQAMTNGDTVFLTSTGCYIVQTETNLIASYLASSGYTLVDNVKDARRIIITTCAVTADSAKVTNQKILDCIGQRKGPHVPVYIVGCYTRIEQEEMKRIQAMPNVHAIAEQKDIQKEFPRKLALPHTCYNNYNNFFSHPFAADRMASYADGMPPKFKAAKIGLGLLDKLLQTDFQFRYLFRNGHLYQPEVQRAIWPVLAAKGCIYKCSYCAVRKGRGRYTSKPPSLVLEEIKEGITQGYDRILLIGDELGTYGVDLKDGTTLSSLLEAVVSEDIHAKFGFWYLDAFRIKEVASTLEKLAQHQRLFFLGITVQSGSQRILKLMNRHYSVAETMDIILSLRKYPEIIIATQFMVGFPTETEEDFQQTMEQVRKGCFDNVEVYCFSPRPGTAAANMPDDVPSEVKDERARMLRETAAKHSRRLFMDYIRKEIGVHVPLFKNSMRPN